MTIQEIVQQRNITKLFHFTHSDNLSSIIENGLLSRSDLDDEGGATTSMILRELMDILMRYVCR